MRKVARLAYASFTTPDLDRQIEYYAQIMGLTLVDKTAETAFLSATIDHHSVVLRRGSEARCERLGLQLSDGLDLTAFARHAQDFGTAERASDVQPGIAEQVTLRDPDGMALDLFASHTVAAHGPSGIGVNPRKLGHVACNVTDINKTVAYYQGALGMVVSDWIGDFFAFMRCGPDHHSVNFVQGQRWKMHHIAFEIADWGAVKETSDFLVSRKIPIIWGPVRHGPGHNVSAYHRNADNQIVELFCELDQVLDDSLGWFEPRPSHQNFPQKPMVWNDIALANAIWGAQPPASFLE